MPAVVFKRNSPVIAPGEKKGTTENGTVEKLYKSGRIKVAFSDGSYGIFERGVLKPFRKASREDRKEAKQESARSTRRASMTDAEKAKAIEVFNELAGHKTPVKDKALGGEKILTAYAKALDVMEKDHGKRLEVYRNINWAMGQLYKHKAVIINHLGRLMASKAVYLTTTDAMKFAESQTQAGKPPKYVLNGMTPDAIAMQITIAVINR